MTALPLPDLPTFAPGWVWLVGAGPGDPGLLTLHALSALKQADVVVHDALVAAEVLALAPDAEKISMGKRGGRASPKQDEISARLIALARTGKRVLRLKGGDPFVFGRGAEEATACLDAGVPVRVVPGITAGIGGLGQAGVPVTHGAFNGAVTFVTGHDPGGDVPALDWAAIAKASPVIVIYMGMRVLDEIATKLMAAGRAGDTPVAVVQNATTGAERVLETSLASAAAEVAEAGMGSPAVICIGPTVALRQVLQR